MPADVELYEGTKRRSNSVAFVELNTTSNTQDNLEPTRLQAVNEAPPSLDRRRLFWYTLWASSSRISPPLLGTAE